MNPDELLTGQPPPTAQQVAWVFHHLNQQYDEGGSFRHLINGRMGFNEGAYGVLMGQGQALSNMIDCARESPEVSSSMLLEPNL